MKKETLAFHQNTRLLTIGVELELQVLNGQTLLLVSRADDIIEALANPKFKHEFFRSTLEVITGICNTAHEVKLDLGESLQRVHNAAEELQLKISSTGTHPEADYLDRQLTPSPRYNNLLDRNQWIIRRMAVYGMHVHLAMQSGDACMRYHNFFLYFVPHLLALSASSPFWQKVNTGLASSRPTMYEAMPTSGMPYPLKNWEQFDKMYQALVRTGSIKSTNDLWLDLRPNPKLGTLELRICDEPATLTEVAAITAYIHMLAMWYRDHQYEWDLAHKRHLNWVFRENKWRALRYGLRGEIIVGSRKRTIPILEDIQHWLERLAPYGTAMEYEGFLNTLKAIVTKGNSAERQLKVFQQTNDLHEVIKHNVREFETGVPQWD